MLGSSSSVTQPGGGRGSAEVTTRWDTGGSWALPSVARKMSPSQRGTLRFPGEELSHGTREVSSPSIPHPTLWSPPSSHVGDPGPSAAPPSNSCTAQLFSICPFDTSNARRDELQRARRGRMMRKERSDAITALPSTSQLLPG